MVADLTIEHFRQHERDTFLIDPGGAGESGAAPIEVTLFDVEDHSGNRPCGADAPRAPFSLLFLGPSDRPLPSGTYRISHDEIGSHELFLNPVHVAAHAQHTEGMFYEVVFS